MKRREFVLKGGMASLALTSSGSMLAGLNSIKGANDKINIGVIGTGSRGGGLIPSINKITNLDVIACCDILPFRLEEGLKKVKGKVKGYSDYRKMLDDKDIDAVVVATPFSTHSEIGIDALDAGKHVYGEKTLAKGYDGIEKLLTTAKSSSKIFQTGHQFRYSHLYHKVVQMVQEGKVGQIANIECQYNRDTNWRRPVPSPELEKIINWRMYKEYSGGLLAELSSHQIDFTNWLLGSHPEQVMGTGGIDYWKDGRETYDNIHLIYSYPNGIEAKFTCICSNATNGYQIKVIGDKGIIIIDFSNAWFYPEENTKKEFENIDGVSGATVQWDQGKGIPINIGSDNSSKQALEGFRDSILNNKNPESNIVTGTKAAVAVQMGLDAMYENKIVKWRQLA